MGTLKSIRMNGHTMTWLFEEDTSQPENEPKDKRQPKNKWLLAISQKKCYEEFKNRNGDCLFEMMADILNPEVRNEIQS